MFGRSVLLLFAALALASPGSAAVHRLFVGTFTSSALYTLAFDDEALTLEVVANTTAYAGSPWIALDNEKKNLFAASWSDPASFASYAIDNTTGLTLTSAVNNQGNCSSSKSIFVVQSPVEPATVYGTTFGACGNVLSTSGNGSLAAVEQNITYAADSGVHGLAVHPSGAFLYSADDSANRIWTHAIDAATGTLTLSGSLAAHADGADPRHVVVHPQGAFLYAVLEGANQVAVYTIDNSTGLPSFTNTTYPLIPENATSSEYWSDEVKVSVSGKYLWASSRARSTNATGYVSAFSLGSGGAVEEQLFLTATTSSGGSANAVSPSDFSDDWVAITDSATGFVEVWRLSGESAVEVVAHVDIVDGGCCANAVWLD